MRSDDGHAGTSYPVFGIKKIPTLETRARKGITLVEVINDAGRDDPHTRDDTLMAEPAGKIT